MNFFRTTDTTDRTDTWKPGFTRARLRRKTGGLSFRRQSGFTKSMNLKKQPSEGAIGNNISVSFVLLLFVCVFVQQYSKDVYLFKFYDRLVECKVERLKKNVKKNRTYRNELLSLDGNC